MSGGPQWWAHPCGWTGASSSAPSCSKATSGHSTPERPTPPGLSCANDREKPLKIISALVTTSGRPALVSSCRAILASLWRHTSSSEILRAAGPAASAGRDTSEFQACPRTPAPSVQLSDRTPEARSAQQAGSTRGIASKSGIEPVPQKSDIRSCRQVERQQT